MLALSPDTRTCMVKSRMLVHGDSQESDRVKPKPKPMRLHLDTSLSEKSELMYNFLFLTACCICMLHHMYKAALAESSLVEVDSDHMRVFPLRVLPVLEDVNFLLRKAHLYAIHIPIDALLEELHLHVLQGPRLLIGNLQQRQHLLAVVTLFICQSNITVG